MIDAFDVFNVGQAVAGFTTGYWLVGRRKKPSKQSEPAHDTHMLCGCDKCSGRDAWPRPETPGRPPPPPINWSTSVSLDQQELDSMARQVNYNANLIAGQARDYLPTWYMQTYGPRAVLRTEKPLTEANVIGLQKALANLHSHGVVATPPGLVPTVWDRMAEVKQVDKNLADLDARIQSLIHEAERADAVQQRETQAVIQQALRGRKRLADERAKLMDVIAACKQIEPAAQDSERMPEG